MNHIIKRRGGKKNKKGVGHVELIVSFSVFLVFVLFLLTYMNPVKPPSISKVLLDVVEQGLDEYKAHILEMPVKVTSGGCFQIECPFDNCSEDHVFIKDEEGYNCGFTYSPTSGNLSINGAGNFFYLYRSDKPLLAHLEPVGCGTFSPTSAAFSVPKLQILYLYSEQEKLNLTYYTNYDYLKNQFGFPLTSDFSIRVYDGHNNIIFTMSVTKPKGVTVKARDMPIVILKDDTKEKIRGSMNIQVW